MEKRVLLVSKFILVVLVLIQLGCKEDEADEQCTSFVPPAEVCVPASEAIACCTEEDCNYTYEGKSYSGTGTLISAMCPEATAANIEEMQAEFEVQTLLLIEQAKTSAICN